MSLPGSRAKRQKSGLLARYSETLGEMNLRKQTEKAIRGARHEAELNARSKSAFLSTMSHELRTPLNAIIGLSYLMREPGAVTAADNAEYASHRQVAPPPARCGGRCARHVEAAIRQPVAQQGFRRDVVAVAVEQIKPEFNAKKQLLDIRLDHSLREVEADHKRVRQILVNLLSKASKFNSPGGRVLLMARLAADGGVTIAIAIADTGIGMTHEDIMLAL